MYRLHFGVLGRRQRQIKAPISSNFKIDGTRKGDLKKDGIKETTNEKKKSNNDEKE
jgi:hypothetical protein